MDENLGKIIENYKILSLLGKGSFAQVYKAVHLKTK